MTKIVFLHKCQSFGVLKVQGLEYVYKLLKSYKISVKTWDIFTKSLLIFLRVNASYKYLYAYNSKACNITVLPVDITVDAV